MLLIAVYYRRCGRNLRPSCTPRPLSANHAYLKTVYTVVTTTIRLRFDGRSTATWQLSAHCTAGNGRRRNSGWRRFYSSTILQIELFYVKLQGWLALLTTRQRQASIRDGLAIFWRCLPHFARIWRRKNIIVPLNSANFATSDRMDEINF